MTNANILVALKLKSGYPIFRTPPHVVNDYWYLDIDGKWYWFNAAGIMVTNTWYQYNSAWYYIGPDGVMRKSQLVENSGKIYAVGADGKMITDPIKLTPDQDGALQYPGLVM